jgi:hypothetical protein
MMGVVPIISGGIFAESRNGDILPGHGVVNWEIKGFAPPNADDDFVVDIAWLTGDAGDVPIGVTPGPVGRRHPYFIVFHRLPLGLADAATVRSWFVEVLPETEQLVRDYLPGKNPRAPAQELADEVAALRQHLSDG